MDGCRIRQKIENTADNLPEALTGFHFFPISRFFETGQASLERDKTVQNYVFHSRLRDGSSAILSHRQTTAFPWLGHSLLVPFSTLVQAPNHRFDPLPYPPHSQRLFLRYFPVLAAAKLAYPGFPLPAKHSALYERIESLFPNLRAPPPALSLFPSLASRALPQ